MRYPALLVALAAFFFSLVVGNGAESASLPAPKVSTGQDPVRVLADAMSYNQETGVYVAYGNAEIHQVDRTLKADIIEYHLQTQLARARGNVILTEGNDVLACDYLEVNLETKEGLVSGGKLFYQKENFHLKGSYLEKLGEDRYRIENGEFTTCDGERPPWKFTCKEADITVEGTAKVKGATFHIKDYPVLYFPYLVYPAKTKRQSGFLTPSAGSSSSEGFNFDNAYFWAISPSSDATAYLDFASEKGTGLGSEYRYIANEASRGRFYGYFISERSSYRRDKYDQLLDRGKDRWNIFYEGKNDFSQDLFARFKVDVV
ncbi:MAG: LPS-assembly protein LptD, partial [Deltaproteobacteria bacterium]|nr:LPS-assembly protein LptD [Deltaproteobacteria bacterium]